MPNHVFDSNEFDTITAAVSFVAHLPNRKVAYLTAYGPLPLKYEHEQGDKHGWLALSGMGFPAVYAVPGYAQVLEDLARMIFTGPVTQVNVFHRGFGA